METTLTKGPILRTLMKLALPIMASSFLGTLYNITDMAWIGLLGSKAMAGVGVGGMFIWLSQGLTTMARMGGQVQVAQAIGRGDEKRARGYACAALQLAGMLGFAFALIMLVFTDPLVGFFQLTDMESKLAALSYTRIACGLIVFPFLSVTMTGIYMAEGDSRTPFLANFIGLVINMILDPVLILGPGPCPKLGATGAAIATAAAQIIVFLILLFGIRSKRKKTLLQGLILYKGIDITYMKGVCRIGIPSALQSMAYCGISMLLTRMVSGYGPEAVATLRVGGQIESVSWNTAEGFGAALNAYVGQNYGAGKKDRIQKGYTVSFACVGAWGLLITAAFVFFPQTIAQCFFHEEAAIAIAIQYLTIIGFCEAFMCIELMTVGALSGLGKTRLCSIISILVTGARIPLAVLFGHAFDLNGIWWAMSVTTIAKGILFVIAFYAAMRNPKYNMDGTAIHISML